MPQNFVVAAAAALSVAGRTKSVMVEATPGTLLYLALILVAVLGVPPSFYTAQPEQQEVVKRFGADVGTAFLLMLVN